jgi:LmbE family N-acetylglucosaminyl deacetylase
MKGSERRPPMLLRAFVGHFSVGLLALLLLLLPEGCARHPAVSERAPSVPTVARQRFTLLAVVAHPDDETLVAPALARYARDGARVFLVIATDGRRGAARWTGIPAGDSLATVRANEARCSARELGLQPPILLGFPDAGLADFAPWPGKRLDTLATRLDSIIQVLRPEAVITWGPEGGYGHADHRLTGQVVTQLFQAGKVPPGVALLYPGFPQERTATAPPWYGQRLHPVRPTLLTDTVPFAPIDRAAAWRSVACHWSQATAEQQARNREALDYLWQGTVTFQRWGPGTRLPMPSDDQNVGSRRPQGPATTGGMTTRAPSPAAA